MNTYGIELEIVGLSPRESASALIRAGIEAQAEGYGHDTRPSLEGCYRWFPWYQVPGRAHRGGCFTYLECDRL
jgi:hypothetical protein